ncbi:hypothetical protein FGG08_001567 [Glutinoglossum americanum]|uniref:Uridine/cytidine kinase n=1 Tax=Glutinoglossum americanum TaxID=1670608 RepID=A0A9P8L584_9PEZI|nr:hypothetical protein FGG08_001567 [Glutinoglossum americanum]
MPKIVDDKSDHCISFILEQLQAHRQETYESYVDPPPLFLGINGVQGVGKTTLVSAIATILLSPPHCLPTVVLSIDDLYLTHASQVLLASSNPLNPLVQHRGEPGTHDIALGLSLFSALKAHQRVKIPAYDKSAFSGQGDRTDERAWEEVNVPGNMAKIQVVIFEGWCVGFRAAGTEELRQKWEDAGRCQIGTLWKHRLVDLEFVNDRLREYDLLTDSLDALIHIDAENTQYVYDWRREQEAALRAGKGAGMTDEQVIKFVDGYYPAYELFSDALRRGVFEGKGKQLRIIVGKDRRANQIIKL